MSLDVGSTYLIHIRRPRTSRTFPYVGRLIDRTGGILTFALSEITGAILRVDERDIADSAPAEAA